MKEKKKSEVIKHDLLLRVFDSPPDVPVIKKNNLWQYSYTVVPTVGINQANAYVSFLHCCSTNNAFTMKGPPTHPKKKNWSLTLC